jgi:O-antigen ligase
MYAGDGHRPTAGLVNPHNGWIEILAEYGIIVTVLFGLLLAKIAGVGWSVYRRVGLRSADGDGDFGLVVAGLVVALPVLSMMNSTFLQPSVVWLLLASMYLIATTLSGRTREPDD